MMLRLLGVKGAYCKAKAMVGQDSLLLCRGNDNSVNMKAAYHHGDLHGAVIAAALDRLSGGYEPSLREVARDIGVSPTAIYRHFPHKDALLDALASEAAEMMGAEQMAASAAAGGGKTGFSACGFAYVAFALKRPALFRLMSSRANLGQMGGLRESRAMRFLHASVDSLLPPESSISERNAMAMHAWSLVHGLSVLILDGQIPPDMALVAAIIERDDMWPDNLPKRHLQGG
jgi:AcrR family transcriptional regulator